jgi:NhaP-type Na+/H+ or K+/H+ antiporter
MYTSYALGDLCKTSGVTSLLVTGLIFNQYGYYNLSTKAKSASLVVFKFLAYYFQGIVFILMGLGFLTLSKDANGEVDWTNDATSMKFFWC